MANKLKMTIEITSEGVVKTLQVNDKTFTEVWKHQEHCFAGTTGPAIDTQLEQAGLADELGEDFMDVISVEDDPIEIWLAFEEVE